MQSGWSGAGILDLLLLGEGVYVSTEMSLLQALTVSAVDFSSLYRFLKGEKVKIEKELDLADATGDMGPVKSIEDAALSILSINITGRGTDGIREYVAFIWEWIHITYCEFSGCFIPVVACN